MLTMHRGKVHASHHGFPFFPLPNPTFTFVSDPSNWVFKDDIDHVSDDEAAPAHSGEAGGEGGDGGDAGPYGVGPGGEGGFNLPNSSGVVLLEEEYTPSLNHSHTGAGPSGFDATHFYQYMDDHFYCLNLRLDAIDEWQQQYAHDQHDLLRRQMEFDLWQCNLEPHVYFAYKHHGWLCPPLDWRPSHPLALTDAF